MMPPKWRTHLIKMCPYGDPIRARELSIKLKMFISLKDVTCIIFLSSTVSPFSATIVVKKLMKTSAMNMKSTQLSKTNHTTFWLSTWWLKKTIFIISQFTNLYFLLTNQNIDWDERWFLETRSWDLKSKENS